MSELSTYDRLFDVCDANYLELVIVAHSYPKKKNKSPNSPWIEARIGLCVMKRDKANKRTPVSSWAQIEPGRPTLEQLSASALTFLERNGMI